MTTLDRASPLDRLLRLFAAVRAVEGWLAVLLGLNVLLILTTYFVWTPDGKTSAIVTRRRHLWRDHRDSCSSLWVWRSRSFPLRRLGPGQRGERGWCSDRRNRSSVTRCHDHDYQSRHRCRPVADHGGARVTTALWRSSRALTRSTRPAAADALHAVSNLNNSSRTAGNTRFSPGLNRQRTNEKRHLHVYMPAPQSGSPMTFRSTARSSRCGDQRRFVLRRVGGFQAATKMGSPTTHSRNPLAIFTKRKIPPIPVLAPPLGPFAGLIAPLGPIR